MGRVRELENEDQVMVAGDTFDVLVDRVHHMVSAGRRMALAVNEFTYTHDEPKVYPGLVLDATARHGGLWTQRTDRDVWCGVVLVDALGERHGFGFGADIYRHSRSETEDVAWREYRDHDAISEDRSKRRKEITYVVLHGGVPGYSYQDRDRIAVSAWNRDGVCTQKVLGFEPERGSW